MADLTVDEALRLGISAHKSGRIKEADEYYTAILQVQPNHPDANHNMGVLAVSVSKLKEAQYTAMDYPEVWRSIEKEFDKDLSTQTTYINYHLFHILMFENLQSNGASKSNVASEPTDLLSVTT